MAQADRGKKFFPFHIVTMKDGLWVTYCGNKVAEQKRSRALIRQAGCTHCKRQWKADNGE
jgi:hypothetical protein